MSVAYLPHTAEQDSDYLVGYRLVVDDDEADVSVRSDRSGAR
jgi:hypothetical protein